MIINTREDCKRINDIVDYILVHTQITVADVKEKFNLSKEEYDLISELMMPAMRWYNRATYYEHGIRRLLNTYKNIQKPEEAHNEEAKRDEYVENEDIPA